MSDYVVLLKICECMGKCVTTFASGGDNDLSLSFYLDDIFLIVNRGQLDATSENSGSDLI